MEPLIQIEPQVARGKLTEGLWKDPNYVAEEKLDGERFKMHIFDNINRFDSRTISKKTNKFTEKTDNVPHLRDLDLSAFAGTVVDGEIKFGNDSMSTSSIMGCLSDEAIRRQTEANKWVDYWVFDVIFYKGRDVRSLPYHERQVFLDEFFAYAKKISSYIKRPIKAYRGKEEFCKEIINSGGEGVILKKLDGLYTDKKAWVKVKAVSTFDVVVMGYEDAKPESIKKGDSVATVTKYHSLGLIGAVKFGQYVNGKLKYFGQCSGMLDDVRKLFSENKDSMLGTVITIEAQSRIPKTGFFRHPRFVRIREDKNALDCIYYEGEK